MSPSHKKAGSPEDSKKSKDMKAKKSISKLETSIQKFESSIDEIIEMLEDAEDHVLSLKKNLSDILELIDEDSEAASAA